MAIEAVDQIEKFQEFLEINYIDSINKAVSKGHKFIYVDFFELTKFDPDLAEVLLDEPEEVIRAAEMAVEQFDIGKPLKVRFINFPESQKVFIRNIRAIHLNKFIAIEGIIRQASNVRPEVISAKFECPSCGNVITMQQTESKFREPTRCTCGRKGKFRLLSKDLVDAQRLVVEESAQSLEGGAEPKRLSIFLREDLVEPYMEKKTTPGKNINITGVLKEVPIPARDGGISTRFEIVMNANSIETVEADYSDVEITEEDEAMIKELSKEKGIYEKLTRSVAPSIFGHEKIKEAIILQLLGGVRKTKIDGTIIRGDIHILLVGDPGAGKSAMLTFVKNTAPKARYIAGRSASGAGITATVVKDEFLRGWALEAGAIVLADKGVLVLDEMDKMTKEDSSALHEGMEQQSYHPDFEIMFSDGTKRKIGEFVDNLMEKNKGEIVKGKYCDILPVDSYEVLTTDFNKIKPINVNRVSRHKAPEYFIQVELSNGRKVQVTPEHPFFVFTEEGYKEIGAENLELGMHIPAPRKLPTRKTENLLKNVVLKTINKQINLPKKVDSRFASLLGYIASEGHTYYDQSNSYAEIGVTNNDEDVLSEVGGLFNSLFKCHINTNITKISSNKKATKDYSTIRCCSVPLYNYFQKNFYGFTFKSPKKYIPNNIRSLNKNLILDFLKTSFKGDGFIDSERFGYSTASYKLASDFSDLLLMHGIWNYIATENRSGIFYYKVVVSGFESMNNFVEKIVSKNDKRLNRLNYFCKRSFKKNNDRDVLPLAKPINILLKELKLSDGYFLNNINNQQNVHVKTINKYLDKIETRLLEVKSSNNIKFKRRKLNIKLNELSKILKCSSATIYNLEKRNDRKYNDCLNSLIEEKIDYFQNQLNKLKTFANSEIRQVQVKSIKKIENKDIKWVYDVTVEPNHTFISEGLILHNTITIAKANIQATLRAQTTILAAANPKFGRFDPFAPLGQQIDLPPALINRFDLIFILRDLPDRIKDAKIAHHVLLHQAQQGLEAELSPLILRKYIAYVKQRIFPVLTNEAMEDIKNFYVNIRNAATLGDENAIKPIPISARQLEAIVRLAEGSARIRLSDKVTRDDVAKSIKLMTSCLTEIGVDPETGQIDIDRISAGISASERGKIVTVRDIIYKLDDSGKKTIHIKDIFEEAEKKGITEQKVEEAIEKLKRSGDIFQPKPNFIQKI